LQLLQEACLDEIEIVEYDPRWPAMFAEEAALLRGALAPGFVVGLEHFGSTAVPGLAAKPIIDILVAIRSLAEVRRTAVEPLRRFGYVFWAENPKTDRMFFVKGMPPYGERRTHHVHLTEPTGEPWLSLPFRDYLRGHPEEAQRYGRLKRELAMRHRTDREAYTAAKAVYVEEILARIKSGGRQGG
jgi:GrpB-like predicted nucleotidyltransferase (UPF0157 family)